MASNPALRSIDYSTAQPPAKVQSTTAWLKANGRQREPGEQQPQPRRRLSLWARERRAAK